MKRFKVEGWYRYNHEKDFNVMTTSQNNIKDAILHFCMYYNDIHFYKIDVKEIV
jgi:hypothetical protein